MIDFLTRNYRMGKLCGLKPLFVELFCLFAINYLLFWPTPKTLMNSCRKKNLRLPPPSVLLKYLWHEIKKQCQISEEGLATRFKEEKKTSRTIRQGVHWQTSVFRLDTSWSMAMLGPISSMSNIRRRFWLAWWYPDSRWGKFRGSSEVLQKNNQTEDWKLKVEIFSLKILKYVV